MAAAPSSSPEITNDGPVINLINKRLRALRKKLNRISQMEESLSQGKTLNKEQEETFRSKPSVLASIDELEKLRQPLSQAVTEEIQLAMEKKDEKSEASNEEADGKGGNQIDGLSVVAELLPLIYFGSIFDVRTLMSAHENMLTRTLERSCCLSYDYVTDDDAAGDPLKEWDLDLISMLGGLLISRPGNTSLSHKIALEKCVEHAKLWLVNSEQPIEPNSDITYAGLREKLNKIMTSDYFTTTPEIKAPVEMATAAGNYNSFQMPVYGSEVPTVNMTILVENSSPGYQDKGKESPNSSHGSEIHKNETGQVEEHHQGGPEVENISEQAQTELEMPNTEVDQNSRDIYSREQQQYPSRRSNQNYRGGRSGRRTGGGFPNGRGGRGMNNRGGYQNGRGQFYDNNNNQGGGGYVQRHYNYKGRGGRGDGPGNHHYGYEGPDAQFYEDRSGGHAQEAS